MPASFTNRIQHPSPQRRRVGWLRHLIGFLGAPTVWAGQMILSDSFSSYACYPHQAPLTDPMWQWLPLALAATSLASLAIGIFCFFIAWTSWKRSRHETRGASKDVIEIGEGRTRFLSLFSIYSSGIFLVAILFSAIAFLIVSPCQKWL